MNQVSKTKRWDVYTLFLHGVVVGMSVLAVLLMIENRQLKRPPKIAQLEIGQSVPTLQVRNLDGGEVTLRWASRPEREKVLLVFTTSCTYCKENQDAWRSLYKDLGQNVDVIGISMDDLEATQAYRENFALPFPVVVPVNIDSFSRAFEISAVPVTLHVSREGKVRGNWLGGLSAEHLADLRSLVANSLNPRPSV